MKALWRRLLDRWRHPGEYTRQRELRLWRATLEAHAPSRGPYVLSTVREVAGGVCVHGHQRGECWRQCGEADTETAAR